MRHIPVLLNEVLDGLNLRSGMNAVDCTLGDGGHSEKILEEISPKGKLIGIDADPEAVLEAKQYLYRFAENFIAIRDNFVNLKKIIQDNNFEKTGAVLLDLGWSSSQFARRGRGFSFQNLVEPLDMRYAFKSEIKDDKTASYILNNYNQSELERVFRKYGEEKNSHTIAEAIVVKRKKKRIELAGELVDIILSVKPRTEKIHPATRIFQALRIEVNNELEVLKSVLPRALEILAPGGRLAVITFHSLEDRIVKQFFQKQSGLKQIQLINKKPIIASSDELKNNPKARSAKLRIVEKN